TAPATRSPGSTPGRRPAAGKNWGGELDPRGRSVLSSSPQTAHEGQSDWLREPPPRSPRGGGFSFPSRLAHGCGRGFPPELRQPAPPPAHPVLPLCRRPAEGGVAAGFCVTSSEMHKEGMACWSLRAALGKRS